MYGAPATTIPDHEARSYVFTTLRRAWVERYDQLAYIEVDPRLGLTWDSAFPLVWDQSTVRGISQKSDVFLDDAANHGISSGICNFHEIFMRSVIERGTAPRGEGAPLSKREKECLTCAAHGLTTEDISMKLGIRARTVQFHFDGIRSKLRAANRQEAIAIAVKAGIINPG